MHGLFPCPVFAGFGASAYHASSRRPVLHQIAASRPSTLRVRLREACPQLPGVYGMLNENGELLYVGKAKRLRNRLQCYFRPRSRDPKAGRILGLTRTIVWEVASCEFAALLRELELIRRLRPRFNVQGQPGRRRPVYLCLGRKPAPYLFLTREPTETAIAYYGPIPSRRQAGEAVRRLNDWFKLRDCPQSQQFSFADQGELFPLTRAPGCLRYEIGTCLGPCAGACTRARYAQQIRAARAFLSGADVSLLQELERKMLQAAQAQAFEQAADLRDQLDSLRWLVTQLERLQAARDSNSFIYPVQGGERNIFWFLIRHGHVEGVMRAPRKPSDWQAAASQIKQAFQRNIRSSRPVPVERMDSILLVAGWFRKYPEERRKTLTPADALALCDESLRATNFR